MAASTRGRLPLPEQVVRFSSKCSDINTTPREDPNISRKSQKNLYCEANAMEL